MKPRTYTSEGIVLARRNYGEADRIISLFSLEHGRISLIAKGVRRPKSRKRGHVEIFSRIKFQAVRGRGIDLMLEAEVFDDFAGIRKSLKKVSLAYYFCEVVGKITHENEKNTELYKLILRGFENLKNTIELKKLRLEFVGELLMIMGYWPNGRQIPDSDRQLEEAVERQIFSARVGRIISS
jgi:DNA repair protein RecO (recombination protein O)